MTVSGLAPQDDGSPESRRPALLARVLESFTATLDLDQVLLRIVSTALEEFGADRAWLLYPASLTAPTAQVAYEVTRSGYEGAFQRGVPVPLEPSRPLIRRLLESGRPVASAPGDPDVDGALWEEYSIRAQLIQILRPASDEPWAFGLHHCRGDRTWTADEIDLFAELGRYAAIALDNALTHRRAVAETATSSAILDQIPEAAAVYDANGRLQRINNVGQRQMPHVFDADLAPSVLRGSDGAAPPYEQLPHLRALRGERVQADYTALDPRTGETRFLRVKASPVLTADGGTAGAVVIAADVTEEKTRADRSARRRRMAECLASLGLDLFNAPAGELRLDIAAERVSEAILGDVRLYLYDSGTDHLRLSGRHFRHEAGWAYATYVDRRPFRSGEGLPGTVFHIGQPLLFAEVRGDAVTDFAREEEERELLAALGPTSVVACPIDSWGERVGVVVIGTSDPGTTFDAEDLAFAQSVALRVGAAVHIHRLNRLTMEGHRAAEELARREVEARARLEAMIDSAPIAIAVVSADELRFESANARWSDFAARFERVSADSAIVGLRVAEVIPGLERALRQTAETGETRIDEALELRHRGESWYVRQTIAPVRGRYSGATQSLAVLVQDVTEQVRAKRDVEILAQTMEERSARLTSILGSMTDALLVYDAGGNVIDVNPAALAMFGIGSRSEAIIRGSLEDLHLRYPDGRPIPKEDLPYRLGLRGETVPDYVAVARHLLTGRDLDLSIAVAPIESTTIVGAVLVIRDITELQELDRKKDEFLSVASHELRTPLTTIKGYAQLLTHSAGYVEEEEREAYLRAILGEVDRMMGLITELLDVSRIETGRLELNRQEVPWAPFVARRVEAFRVQNPEREIAFRTSVDDVTVFVDADRMRQVVDNLISNATKYSPDGTPVEVTVRMTEQAIETVVRDYGIGIPADEVPKLFDRFHRARNVSSRYYGGLGLGLYIAAAIVQAHHGEIGVESAEGAGSSFTIVLPRG